MCAFYSCSQTESSVENHVSEHQAEVVSEKKDKEIHVLPDSFERTSIVTRLAQKLERQEPRVIQVFVPLCDNDHQGIVPVNSSLGNGLNLRTNLYWGAGYGVYTHFKRSSDWQKQSDTVYPKTNTVLQRVCFKHATSNTYLVMDAYRGDRMVACLTDYFHTLSGERIDSVNHSKGILKLGSNVDLVVFNGHNGLMDELVEAPYNQDSIPKDAVAIACASHYYFAPKLQRAGGYPLLLTTNLLAPEAYVLHAVLDAWILDKSPREIRKAAGLGYHNVQKCGLRGATNLFRTGW